MVSEEVILKSLDEAILKSHQHLRLGEMVTATFDKFHDETCGNKLRKTEKAIVTDNKGNILYQKNGGKSSVTLDSRELYNAFKEHGELHVTHNHPRTDGSIRSVAECLSEADIDNFLNDYTYSLDGGNTLLDEPVFIEKSISCESPNGSRMTLVRGDKYKDDDYNKALDYSSKLSNSFLDYEGLFLNTLSDMKENYPYNSEKYSYQEYCEFLTNKSINKIGKFEESDKFKSIQRDFRNINLKLTMTYPSDYNVVYYL